MSDSIDLGRKVTELCSLFQQMIERQTDQASKLNLVVDYLQSERQLNANEILAVEGSNPAGLFPLAKPSEEGADDIHGLVPGSRSDLVVGAPAKLDDAALPRRSARLMSKAPKSYTLPAISKTRNIVVKPRSVSDSNLVSSRPDVPQQQRYCTSPGGQDATVQFLIK
jgi:hypothetical protein